MARATSSRALPRRGILRRLSMAALTPNARAAAVAESATLAITARAAEMLAAGQDVVSLSAGEPDFPTPADVARAGVRAIESGDTRYTATSGLPELRRAAAEWLGRQFGLRYSPREVMVTAGAKAALHMALTAIVSPGDPVLLLAPYWVSYPDLVRIAGGEPVVLPPVPEQGFVHTRAQIEAAARRTGARGILLNYPNNPSGAVPTREQMAEIVAACAACDLWIVSDEIYATMTYDGRAHVSPATIEGARERTLFVGGATKSHSFTGWRVAFLAGPADIVAAAGRIQSQVIGNPCTISQRAAIAICQGDHREELARRMAAFDERRRYLVAQLQELPDLALAPPQGAFYALVDARRLCQRLGIDDAELARRLLEEALLAVVPGSAFAIPGFIRLSYAASMDELRRAVPRLHKFCGAG
jgi:aspartate aminotransferase